MKPTFPKRGARRAVELPMVIGTDPKMARAAADEAARLVAPLAWISDAWPALGPLLTLLWVAGDTSSALLSVLLVYAANAAVNVDVSDKERDTDPATVTRWVVRAIHAVTVREKRPLPARRAVAMFLREGINETLQQTVPDPAFVAALLWWAHEPPAAQYDAATWERARLAIDRVALGEEPNRPASHEEVLLQVSAGCHVTMTAAANVRARILGAPWMGEIWRGVGPLLGVCFAEGVPIGQALPRASEVVFAAEIARGTPPPVPPHHAGRWDATTLGRAMVIALHAIARKLALRLGAAEAQRTAAALLVLCVADEIDPADRDRILAHPDVVAGFGVLTGPPWPSSERAIEIFEAWVTSSGLRLRRTEVAHG